MAVTLIVETGSGDNPAANTYGDYDGFLQYATDRGQSALLTSADAAASMLISAMDYLSVQDWAGVRTDAHATDDPPSFQPLDWPRKCVRLNLAEIADDAIPSRLIMGQYAAALEIAKGNDLMPSVASPFVTQETVGPITTKYAVGETVGFVPSYPMIDAILSPFIKGATRVGRLLGVRV